MFAYMWAQPPLEPPGPQRASALVDPRAPSMRRLCAGPTLEPKSNYIIPWAEFCGICGGLNNYSLLLHFSDAISP